MQLTGSVTWANSKIAAAQNVAMFSALTTSYSLLSNTASAEKETELKAGELKNTSCDDPTCNFHGTCIQSKCGCDRGKITMDHG